MTSTWRQLNVTCPDPRAAEQAAAISLGPQLTRAQDAGALASWWFIRKAGTWRVRMESPADGLVEQVTAQLLDADGVASVTETVYEPEETAFGGPAAMDIAHRLFSADSRHLLGQIAGNGCALRREVPVVLASKMLRAARQEWHEQGDCWARLAAYRSIHGGLSPEPAAVDAMQALLTGMADAPGSPLHARPDWGGAFEYAGRQLAELASRGILARGLRSVLAHHLLFLFNRHGVPAADQYLLASAARQAVFGPPEEQEAGVTRKPGGGTAVTATVGPVTATVSSSDEDHIARLRDALADYIKGWGTFKTPQVEVAFRTVSRHLFLPGASLDDAYSRSPVVTRRAPDGTSLSSASSPQLVATMLEQLAVEPGQRVLEIGAATGFNAALLAELSGPAGAVVTVELDSDLVAEAARNLACAGYPDVQVICGDGAAGHPGHAPYDRIIVTAEAWDIVPAWWDQLTPDGRMVVPVRLHGSGLTRAIEFRRLDHDTLSSASAAVCGFVPMRGSSEHADQRIRLDSDAVLKVDAADQPDTTALARVLTYPEAGHWTGILVRDDEPAEHLDLWLATTTTTASFSRLGVTKDARARGVANPAMRWAGASLYQGGTLAYITARDITDDTSELGITTHGPDSAALTEITRGLLQQWYHQRPAQPAITASRTPAGLAAGPGAIRIARPWTTFSVAW
jgi:protein-L-isoaspartate(D-aspartate) O-methyltransferase